jgi:hypothetical protein
MINGRHPHHQADSPHPDETDREWREIGRTLLVYFGLVGVLALGAVGCVLGVVWVLS